MKQCATLTDEDIEHLWEKYIGEIIDGGVIKLCLFPLDPRCLTFSGISSRLETSLCGLNSLFDIRLISTYKPFLLELFQRRYGNGVHDIEKEFLLEVIAWLVDDSLQSVSVLYEGKFQVKWVTTIDKLNEGVIGELWPRTIDVPGNEISTIPEKWQPVIQKLIDLINSGIEKHRGFLISRLHKNLSLMEKNLIEYILYKFLYRQEGEELPTIKTISAEFR